MKVKGMAVEEMIHKKLNDQMTKNKKVRSNIG